MSKRVRYNEPLELYYYDKINLLNRCEISGKCDMNKMNLYELLMKIHPWLIFYRYDSESSRSDKDVDISDSLVNKLVGYFKVRNNSVKTYILIKL